MTTKGSAYCLTVCLFIFVISYNFALGSRYGVIRANRCLQSTPVCFRCRAPINVTIRAVNRLVDSNFELEALVSHGRGQPLQTFLEKAGSVTPEFNRFKTTYYKDLGYYIESLNGIASSVNSKVFWHILSEDTPLECGVSSYIPRNNEVILFNFTTYRDAGYE